MNYKLTPSDLTFLYEGCKHCFALKVKHGISQPSIPLPGVFSTIASLQKEYYSDKRTEDFCPELPPGTVRYGEQRVRSGTIEIPGSESTCYINGRFDIVAELDDSSFAVMDFKTGNPNDEKSVMYGRQLHAYAISLENPDPGALKLSPVTKMGLLYFTPDKCEQRATTRQAIEGEMKWIEIKRNDSAFLGFLKEIVNLLDGPIPEPQPVDCDWCSYQTKKGSYMSASSNAVKDALTACPQCNGPMQLKSGRYGKFWSCLNFPNCKGTRDA
jgi:hypothetical protein